MSEALQERAPISGRTRWFALGALLIVGGAFSALAFSGIGENLVYYWAPKDLKAAGDRAYGATIRLGGMVVPGSIQMDEKGTSLSFEVTDGVEKVPVFSRGVPPQMFRENIGVIVEGTMVRSEGRFESHRLMVSHDNEYRAPKAGEHPDVQTMIRNAKFPGDEP